MKARNPIAWMRAAIATGRREGEELERLIAAYNSNSYASARQRQSLDRELDKILGRRPEDA